MFFFHFNTGAADAFKLAIKSENITYEDFANRIGVSRGTITKFIGGRPLSPELLRAILGGLPENSRKQILIGHLRDEVRRAGFDPTKLVVLDQNTFTPLLGRVAELLTQDPQRVVDLMTMVDRWERNAKQPDPKK